jgi:hypothetical protein
MEESILVRVKEDALKRDKERQALAEKEIKKWWIGLIIIIAVISLVCPVIIFAVVNISSDIFLPALFGSWLLFLGIVGTVIILLSYQQVPRNHKWIISFCEKWFITLDVGHHIVFPIFTSMVKDFPIISQSRTLSVNGQTGGEVVFPLRVYFSDTSATVIVKVSYLIFDWYQATYGIDNLPGTVESIIKPIVGDGLYNKKFDEAMLEYERINLSKLIQLNEERFILIARRGIEISNVVVNFSQPKKFANKKDLIKRWSVDQPARLKRLKRLMGLCWKNCDADISMIVGAAFSSFTFRLIDREHTKDSKDYHSTFLLDELESILGNYICFDCEVVGAKFCKQGHCLNCAKKLKPNCLDCAHVLGYEICGQCGTVDPATDDSGRCLRCLELAGNDVCYECGRTNPNRCSRCGKCRHGEKSDDSWCNDCEDDYQRNNDDD